MGALRELFARFTVQFDKRGLLQGDAAVTRLAAKTDAAGSVVSNTRQRFRDFARNLLQNATAVHASGDAAQTATGGFRGFMRSFTGIGQQAHVAAKGLHDLQHGASHVFQHMGVPGWLIGGGVAAGVVGLAHKFHQFASEISSTSTEIAVNSKVLGIGVEEYQAWAKTIQMAGGQAGALRQGGKFLAVSMNAAAKAGGSEQAKTFKQLGIAYQNADGSLRPLSEVLLDVGDKLGSIDDRAKALALGTKILGRGAMGLMPAFEAGGDALRRTFGDMVAAGGMSEELIEKGRELHHAELKLASGWKKVRNAIMLPVVPALTKISYAVGGLLKWLGGLSKTTGIVQSAFIALGAFGAIKLITALGGLKNILALVNGQALLLLRRMLPWIALALILEDIVVWARGGKSAFGDLLDAIFGAGSSVAILAGIRDAFSEIGPAIAGLLPELGKFSLAIVKSGLDLIAMLATSADSPEHDRLVAKFLQDSSAIGNIFDWVAQAFSNFIYGLGEQIVSWASDTVVGGVASAMSAIEGIIGKKTFKWIMGFSAEEGAKAVQDAKAGRARQEAEKDQVRTAIKDREKKAAERAAFEKAAPVMVLTPEGFAPKAPPALVAAGARAPVVPAGVAHGPGGHQSLSFKQEVTVSTPGASPQAARAIGRATAGALTTDRKAIAAAVNPG